MPDLSHPLTDSNTGHPICGWKGATPFPGEGPSGHSLQDLRTHTGPPPQGPPPSDRAASAWPEWVPATPGLRASSRHRLSVNRAGIWRTPPANMRDQGQRRGWSGALEHVKASARTDHRCPRPTGALVKATSFQTAVLFREANSVRPPHGRQALGPFVEAASDLAPVYAVASLWLPEASPAHSCLLLSTPTRSVQNPHASPTVPSKGGTFLSENLNSYHFTEDHRMFTRMTWSTDRDPCHTHIAHRDTPVTHTNKQSQGHRDRDTPGI